MLLPLLLPMTGFQARKCKWINFNFLAYMKPDKKAKKAVIETTF